MPSSRLGHVQRLASGSYRVSVYAGVDPLSGRELRYRRTAKTEEEAQIVLGKLLEQSAAGRRPDSRVTVGEVLDRYLEIAELDYSTRHTYEGYVRRTIRPVLGSMELRKVRGPILDTFYAKLHRCGDVACNGRPFTEHSMFPPLIIAPGSLPPAWMQVARIIKAAIGSGQLRQGEEVPSAQELGDRYGISPLTIRHAMLELDKAGLIKIHHGRCSVVTGTATVPVAQRARPGAVAHDCAASGCRRHVCRPMAPMTIRQIHAILSGAFATAVRWEWIERNPAAMAKLPKARPRTPSSPTPDGVAKVIAIARELGQEQLALYLWLAAVTGARRGELCGLQWADIDLEDGLIHVAYSYLVKAGVKLRKDTKTHQDRYLAIDPVTVTVLGERWDLIRDQLGRVGVASARDAYVFSNDSLGTKPWNPGRQASSGAVRSP